MSNPSIFDPVPLQPKSITFSHIKYFLEQVGTHSDSLSLTRKSIFINNIARYFYMAIQNWMRELQRTRHAICFEAVSSQQRKRRVGASTSRKKIGKYSEERGENRDLSIQHIAEEVLQQPDRNTISNNKMITPSKKPLSPMKSPDLNFPFPQEALVMMQEIDTEDSKLKISETSSVSNHKWQPKLEQYQNFLGLTQKGIPLTTTRKARTAEGTAKRNKKIDKEIIVSANDELDIVRQLQLLDTKSKAQIRRDQQEQNYFTFEFEKVHYQLKRIQPSSEQLIRLREHYQSKPVEMVPIDIAPMFTSYFSGQQPVNEQALFSQAGDPSVTEQLQEVIKDKISLQLQHENPLSFNFFSHKYNIKKQARGQLFYQLLHTDFDLSQSRPQQFGDILIHSGVSL